MQPIKRFSRAVRRPALAAALLLFTAGAVRAEGGADHVDITAVTIEGASAEQCAERTTRVAWQSRALSLATTPPYDLAEGMRTFHDHMHRLDRNGELASTAHLSTVYVAGYTEAGERILRVVLPFVRVEVARPHGTPAGAPSRISIAWLWLQRLAEVTDAAGRMVEQPHLHRFDFLGEVEATYGTWGHAVAPCRVGVDGRWVGAVAVWSYLPP